MNKKTGCFLSLLIKIVTGILLLFVPYLSNLLTLTSNTLGSYAVAYFLASCAIFSFAIIYIGNILSLFVSSFIEK